MLPRLVYTMWCFIFLPTTTVLPYGRCLNFQRECTAVSFAGRVLEPACFGTAPAPRIFNPEPAPSPAPGKREQKFGFF